MAECLECTDGLSMEDILMLVTTCDESGNVSWRLYEVTDDTEDCHSCAEAMSILDLLRKSLYCEDGVYYLRVTMAS